MSEEVKTSTPRSIKVIEYVDGPQLKRDLGFSTADLSSAMQDQAALFADYGVKASQASMQVDKMKLLLDNTEAEVSRRERDAKVLKGEKVTEPQLAAIVTRHPRVVAAKQALNEAKQIESVAKTAVEAFRHRRDMLVQQGLISREEMKGELSVAVRNAREEESRGQQQRILDRRRDRNAGSEE